MTAQTAPALHVQGLEKAVDAGGAPGLVADRLR